ncbi:hypothetical protein O181_029149 [Austropuccinia psidii MF-1]|uniref:Uncharacterized protein n=1 Tax=Austropuccinia psidii MF-1 TaxID=1389203 RepID=A0A9Q3CQC6_9BASI|nr:hypothetical protein [Austropuccinia psidii MF-1]
MGPPEPILAPNLNILKNGPKDPRTQIGQEQQSGHLQPLASENHQRPLAQVQKAFPSIQGKDSPLPIYSVPRIQAWCIYGMIYHYAPILLRNPMVMLSGTNYSFSIKVPKSITNFEGSLSVIQSCNTWRLPDSHSRIPTTWPCRSGIGSSFQDYFKGNFKRL